MYKNKKIPMDLKTKISTTGYALQSWKLDYEKYEQLKRHGRNNVGYTVKWPNIRQLIKISNVIAMIKWTYAGHLVRSDPCRC